MHEGEGPSTRAGSTKQEEDPRIGHDNGRHEGDGNCWAR